MKYSNWQELHKKAYSNRTEQCARVAKTDFSIGELHLRAWARLVRLCSVQELNRLNHLAFMYDHGFKKNDTFFK